MTVDLKITFFLFFLCFFLSVFSLYPVKKNNSKEIATIQGWEGVAEQTSPSKGSIRGGISFQGCVSSLSKHLHCCLILDFHLDLDQHLDISRIVLKTTKLIKLQ